MDNDDKEYLHTELELVMVESEKKKEEWWQVWERLNYKADEILKKLEEKKIVKVGT